MQNLSSTDLIAIVALLLGMLNFLFGGGVLRSRFKSKPEIKITHLELSPADPAQGGRRYLSLTLRNEGRASASNFNMEIKILGQMQDFESLPLGALTTEIFKPRTQVFVTFCWTIPEQKVYLVATTVKSYRLPVNQIHKISVRFAYEGEIEDPRYEIVLDVDESNSSLIYVSPLVVGSQVLIGTEDRVVGKVWGFLFAFVGFRLYPILEGGGSFVCLFVRVAGYVVRESNAPTPLLYAWQRQGDRDRQTGVTHKPTHIRTRARMRERKHTH